MTIEVNCVYQVVYHTNMMGTLSEFILAVINISNVYGLNSYKPQNLKCQLFHFLNKKNTLELFRDA